MTAFAREEFQGDLGRLSWEMRTVNHRYQETSMRLPDELRAAEPVFRTAIAKVIHRGRVDAVLHYQSLPTSASEHSVDIVAVERLAEWEEQVRGIILDVTPLSTIDILRWPGVLSTTVVDSDQLLDEALSLLRRALITLSENRRREGQKLAEILQERVASVRIIVKQVLADWPAVEMHFRSRLEERTAALAEKLEPGRLEQELVLLLSRADIREEIDRLLMHLEETERVLISEGPIGRRLDFLMQELNRESNTLGSKSSHPTITAASVDLKVLIEQMREQIQNIE